MAKTTIWQGRAQNTAQVDTITIAGVWASADTATITINAKNLVLTVGTDDTTANVATAIKEMINGDSQTGTGDHTFATTGNLIPEFSILTATVTASVVSVTADTAGTPFTMTVAETAAGTATRAAGTANKSANDANDADNWSNGVPSLTGDTVILENTASGLKWNLTAFAAVDLAVLEIKSTFTGDVGLPQERVVSAGSFAEYFDQYLQFEFSTVVKIGQGDGTGSGRIKLDMVVATVSTFYIYGSASGSETGIPAILIKTAAAANVLYNHGASVGLAVLAGEAAQFAAITQTDSASELVISSGVALTTLNVEAGTVTCECAYTAANLADGTVTVNGTGAPATTNVTGATVTINSTGAVTTFNVGDGTLVHNGGGATIGDLNQTGGTVTLNGTGTITGTATIEGGIFNKAGGQTITTFVLRDATFNWNDGGTITTGSVYKNGIMDCRNSAEAKAITNLLNLYDTAYVYDPSGTITLGAGFKLNACDFDDMGALQLGDDNTWT